MMNTAAEEDSLRVDCKVLEIFAVPVAFIVFENILKNLSHCEIIFAVLIPVDIPAEFCSFAEVIEVLFLFERKVIPSGDLITHDFNVSEFIDEILEIR